jgi:hypothetical protein
MPPRYPCPCCGYLTYEEPPGSYAICDVCFWEDDIAQLRWPLLEGGPNRWCLVDGQANYAAIGAMDAEFLPHVRPPEPDEERDPGWRPVDMSVDDFEFVDEEDGQAPSDLTTLYWWRDNFWRREDSDEDT